MLLMKLKTMTAAMLVAAVLAIPATGLAYRVMAGEKENQTQRQEVQSDQPRQVVPLKDQKAPEQPDKAVLLKAEVELLKAEVERLRPANEAFKKKLPRPDGKGKAGEAQLVIKVRSVKGWFKPGLQEKTEARSLIKVITHTIEPKSWDCEAGEGWIEYLQYADLLVVGQTRDNQKQVETLLHLLGPIGTHREKAEQDKK